MRVLKSARDELSHFVLLEKGTGIKCIVIHSDKGFVSHSVIACASQLKYILDMKSVLRNLYTPMI